MVDNPTPCAPPFVWKPTKHPIDEMLNPKNKDLMVAETKSLTSKVFLNPRINVPPGTSRKIVATK